MLNLNLLILNGDLPVFPGRAGHEYLNTTRLANWAQTVGLVSMVHTPEQAEKKSRLLEQGVQLYLWENPYLSRPTSTVPPQSARPRRIGKALYQLLQARLTRPRDTRIEDYQFRNLSGPILQALDQAQWQALIIVQSKCARWLDYLPKFPASVLVMHDIRARVYARQAQASTSVLQRVRLNWEAWRYRQFERNYCRKFDLVITVSTADEVWAHENYQLANVVTVPIPVDGEYFRPMIGIPEQPTRIVFTGMMDHGPNVDGAIFFALEVLPRVQAEIPEAEFWIVGRDPAPQVQALAAQPGVVVTGWVPDIRPYLAQAGVVVVPLRYGSGMRNKILEAWGMQKCVISTPVGAEGLDYHAGENILMADDAPALALRTVEALRDRVLRDRIRQGGREVITQQHQPDQLAQHYYTTVANVVRQKQCQRDPLQAVIDLRWMHPAVAGGIENLSRSFLEHLLLLDGFNRYTLLVPPEVQFDFDLRNHSNVTVRAADNLSDQWRRLRQRGSNWLQRRFRMDNWRSREVEQLCTARSYEADVALSMPGYIAPDMIPLKNVLYVLDFQYEYYPEFFSPHELEERRRVFGSAIHIADHLLAISEYTRQTVIDRFEVAPERVTTVYPAANPIFHPHNRAKIDVAAVLQKYGLPAGQYLFFPANTWPHKNHRAAIQALQFLRDTYHLDPLLVCTGSTKEAHPELLSLTRDLGLEKHVKFLGYCPIAEMPALYAGAAALVFPSFFEGFGIPLTEAMWCGCPIVSSHATCLPEIAGEAALWFDPHLPEQLADAIQRVLTDSELRRQLIERGFQQVQKFSWQTFTLETIRILRQVYEMRYG